MRLIPSYASNHMYALVAAVTLIDAAAAAAAAAAAGTRSSSSKTNIVTVMSNSYEPIDLQIPSNGDLVYADLSQRTDFSEAIALSNVKAKCFFWRSTNLDSNDEDLHSIFFATNVFTASGTPGQALDPGLGISFQEADRVYCYDGSRDSSARRDTFTLFVDPEDEQVRTAGQYKAELLRVKVGKDDDFAEMPLRISKSLKAQLGDRKGVRVKLIDWPIKGGSANFVPMDDQLQGLDDDREDSPSCDFLVAGQPGLGYSTRTDPFSPTILLPIDSYDRVVCFRNQDDQRMKRNWLQERSNGQQG